MRTMVCFVLAAAVAAGCGAGAVATPRETAAGGSAGEIGTPMLPEGPVTPGRYAFVVKPTTCEDAGASCPAGSTQPQPVHVELTVPDGWEGFPGFGAIFPYPSRLRTEDNARDGAIVMGWTNIYVGLNSDPCAPPGTAGHLIPDIPVGPTVDDFVDAVVAHPILDVTEPTDVELGGYQGRFFTLTGPSDISMCDDWRPWDPGFYVQGPDNIWDVWVLDIDGFRMLIVTQYFPDTPEETRIGLRAMVDSIRFVS